MKGGIRRMGRGMKRIARRKPKEVTRRRPRARKSKERNKTIGQRKEDS